MPCPIRAGIAQVQIAELTLGYVFHAVVIVDDAAGVAGGPEADDSHLPHPIRR